MAEQTFVSHLVPWISLGGSVFSTLCTGYFWLVKSNRERANLKTFLIQHDFFLAECRDTTRTIGVQLHLAVANYSTLPNAALRFDLQVKCRDGAWQPIAKVTMDQQTPLPMNLPPLQTAMLKLTGRIPFEYREELESQRPIERAYLDFYLATPFTIKLAVRGLSEKETITVLHAHSETRQASVIKLAA